MYSKELLLYYKYTRDNDTDNEINETITLPQLGSNTRTPSLQDKNKKTESSEYLSCTTDLQLCNSAQLSTEHNWEGAAS